MSWVTSVTSVFLSPIFGRSRQEDQELKVRLNEFEGKERMIAIERTHPHRKPQAGLSHAADTGSC